MTKWGIKELGDIGDVKMCKRILKNQTNEIGGIPFYKIGTFGKKEDSYISEELYNEFKSKYSFPKKGDVLISASGTIGRTVVYDGEPAYFQDSNIVWIEHNGKMVLNNYLWYFYKVADWDVAGGVTIKRLYNDNLKRTKIPVPPLSEQEKIVEKLDKADELVKLNQKALDEAEKLPMALFIKTFGDPHENPNGYEIKTLGDIGDVIAGGTPSSKVKEYFDGDIAWLTPKDLSGYKNMYISNGSRNITELGLQKSSAKLLPKGTVLISSRAPIGYVAIAKNDITTNQGFKNLVLKNDLIPEYVYYWVKSNVEYLQSLGTGATFKEISSSTVKNIQIPVPPLSEQQEFTKQLKPIEKMVAQRKQALEKSKQLFDSILNKELDPNQ